MFVLLVTLCAGLSCVEAEWQLPPEVRAELPHNCMAAANVYVPEWLKTRPRYRVKRLKCVPYERVQRDV